MMKASRKYRRSYKGIPSLNKTNQLGSKFTDNTCHRKSNFVDEHAAVLKMKKSIGLKPAVSVY
jgi:hypothetical protein